MALLGPAPAAAIGVAVGLVDMVVSPRPWDKPLNNLAVLATFPLVGGLLVNLLLRQPDPGRREHDRASPPSCSPCSWSRTS